MVTVNEAPHVDAILDRYEGRKRDALIPLLQDLQEANGFLTREILVRCGRRLGIPVSKIYGVASFYNQFRFRQPGLYQVQVCRGTACHVKGSFSVLEAVRRELKIEPGETTRDGLFSLEVVACVGACGLAPVICINGEFYAGVAPDSISEIFASLRRKAQSDA
jgi:NADH:ubiquinone oxidoreductase subunit E